MNSPLSAGTRFWIIFAQVFGTVFMVVGLISYCAYLEDFKNYLTGPNGADVVNSPAAIAEASFICAILVYFTWKSIWSAVVIIRAVNKMDDLTLSANKWMISAVSLSAGGLFTPYLMTLFPNINIKSTIKPKVWLPRVFGIFMLVGAPLAMLTYGLMNKGNFGGTGTEGYTIALFVIAGFLTVLGVANVATFYSKNANMKYDESGWMHFLANTTLVIITLELVVVMISAVLELVAAVFQLISRSGNNFFYILLNLLNVVIYALYVGLVWWVTWETMTGIWKDQVDFTTFKAADDYQQNHANPAM
ncbi:hypothetical protein [Mesoplasma lactucae]|uniref:Uncharacterized protein n=1 Tax=Mesoplasma lactucae ATCC 49193 TaxID=81460 RepID=A0A291IS13_9MOLU|nr:hypothetical protein [Mesoplasma lactucae]ATG97550.1 hypothetical protein CP520_02170 [Mesoplasma lactucae ATCC 49193]ATZ19991.1 hypothetical protein MLACT_v1c01690 [Mesoplasma lactucae ATCC 49193]MCL8217058.1 hypothetical protein [Mesoplasma lactucae ATCC 49193]